MPTSVSIVACSPRAGGNSDVMAQYMAQGIEQGGGQANIVYLREHTILPCTGCGACFAHVQQQCVLEHKDDTARLFQLLEGASPVVLTAPIYFYHVPAQLKAFMDRAQKYWAKRECTSSVVKPYIKTLTVGLVAARVAGDNLFTGSLMSLRLFADVFHRNLGETSLWRGYDGPQDFIHDAVACDEVRALGQRLVTMAES